MALLSKKLQRILREKRNKEKRRPIPQRKNPKKKKMSKEDHLIIIILQIHNPLALNEKNQETLNWIAQYIFKSY